jgi:hypothetical protein
LLHCSLLADITQIKLLKRDENLLIVVLEEGVGGNIACGIAGMRKLGGQLELPGKALPYISCRGCLEMLLVNNILRA